jgi:hypothetical protein
MGSYCSHILLHHFSSMGKKYVFQIMLSTFKFYESHCYIKKSLIYSAISEIIMNNTKIEWPHYLLEIISENNFERYYMPRLFIWDIY